MAVRFPVLEQTSVHVKCKSLPAVFYERSKRMGIYRVFYAGGSVDLGADDFHITEDGRVMFVRNKEYIACYVLANITGFVKVE